MKGPFWLIRMVCLVMGCSAMSCGDSSTPEDKPTEESTDTGASVEATDAGDELASSPDAGSQDAATQIDATTETDAASGADADATETDADAATGGTDPGSEPEPPDAAGAVLTDDFESGASGWDIIQGTCSVMADATSVLTCLNGGNEARAVAAETFTDMTVAANVKIHQMDDGRRVYLAGRFVDSNNWYGAAFYNSGTRRVQIRKKVAGSSSDIAEATFPFELDQWYTLKLQISGSTLTLSVDGVVQCEGTDTDFTSGGVALLVDRSEVSWDNVVVTVP